MPISLLQTPTPALVLDRGRCRRNCLRMARRMSALGVRLRPHLKTAKSAEVARMAVTGHFGGVSVSTLREAEYLAARGVRDVRLAACPSPTTAVRAAALVADGVALSMIVDCVPMVRVLDAAAQAHAVELPVLVEVDSGEHRTGVDPEGEQLLAVARALQCASGLRLAGVLTHAGQAYSVEGRRALAAVAEVERRLVTRAASRLRAEGLPCDEVSAGSTPTASHALALDGVTEMRPGVYVFGDLFQAARGTCARDDVAISVLATVIANRPPEKTLVLDAGALALSKDRSTAATQLDAGYGLVVDVAGRFLGELHVDEVHQEHGAIHGVETGLLASLPVGSRVRVLPNHACMTAAAYQRYLVVEGEDPTVLAEWERVNGW